MIGCFYFLYVFEDESVRTRRRRALNTATRNNDRDDEGI